VGIVLLGVELRQNNVLLNSQVRTDGFNAQTGLADIVLQNTELVSLMERDPASLTQTERNSLLILGLRAFVTFETGYEKAQFGLVSEVDLARSLKSTYNRPMINYGMPLAWSTYKDRSNAAFIEFVERSLTE
jgi:hypothetical protein